MTHSWCSHQVPMMCDCGMPLRYQMTPDIHLMAARLLDLAILGPYLQHLTINHDSSSATAVMPQSSTCLCNPNGRKDTSIWPSIVMKRLLMPGNDWKRI
ncbi:hypothetical protein VitviT2T_026530 [Vitis vinifera]|uniref:Uncharacterized protein n=1 Tax=Vitis vinifera TaxID=29760 RepID=A0ABY9DMH5_VITVI|nr:hypothetical protein VitviT2T_026530 [Vitis vinifera]